MPLTPDVTAMTITTVTSNQNHDVARPRVWPRIPGWAAELGLTAPDAITRASEPPERTSNQEPATSRADPETGL
jgi:hypothetical protein